ncbi:hypothetical protein BJ138DRAFT_1166897 [Hygrophoropsis aurantiaca]|uniref:Uncharacterized protein n=1 Tax=Hygrophoropsis aurantiaca TaxID=72124 RepID=A0ACB7ZV85_9AGAM|nr:hypothetical protein BJ138DRAFT_1166897 [Hygrophoropsis aurantiaca]
MLALASPAKVHELEKSRASERYKAPLPISHRLFSSTAHQPTSANPPVRCKMFASRIFALVAFAIVVAAADCGRGLTAFCNTLPVQYPKGYVGEGCATAGRMCTRERPVSLCCQQIDVSTFVWRTEWILDLLGCITSVLDCCICVLVKLAGYGVRCADY